MKRAVFWLAVALVALSAADLVLTRYLLAGGEHREGNFLAALFIGSLWLAVPIKLGVPALAGAGHIHRTPTRGRVVALSVVVFIYVAVVCWNLHWVVLGA